MQCPCCGAEMLSGVANVETWSGGPELLDLFVRRPGMYFCADDRNVADFAIGDCRRGFYCTHCEALLLPPQVGSVENGLSF